MTIFCIFLTCLQISTWEFFFSFFSDLLSEDKEQSTDEEEGAGTTNYCFFFKGNGIVFTSVCLREHPEESVLQVLHYISLPGTLRFLTEHFQRSRRKV